MAGPPRNPAGAAVEIVSHIWTDLGGTDILAMLNVLIREPGMPLPHLVLFV